MTMTFAEAAAELRMSERWLRDWLSHNPMDAKGNPFYIRKGRRKEFEPADIERIHAQLRENEKCRLNSTDAAPSGITAGQLGRLAAGKGCVVRPTPKTKTLQRARSPKSKSDTGTVISKVRPPS